VGHRIALEGVVRESDYGPPGARLGIHPGSVGHGVFDYSAKRRPLRVWRDSLRPDRGLRRTSDILKTKTCSSATVAAVVGSGQLWYRRLPHTTACGKPIPAGRSKKIGTGEDTSDRRSESTHLVSSKSRKTRRNYRVLARQDRKLGWYPACDVGLRPSDRAHERTPVRHDG